MKKTFRYLMIVMISALVACASKEQTDLRTALVARLGEDSDLKDYSLDPEEIADCIVHDLSDDLPGFPGDPKRQEYLKAYTQFVSASGSGDASAAVEQHKALFGSAKEAMSAALKLTDYTMSCMGRAIEGKDPHRNVDETPAKGGQEDKQAAPAGSP